MMERSKEYLLEFITPAFLAGADQATAELRAASVRGALRWWFRVLGGTNDEETEVFGGVQSGAKRSKVMVRCCIEKHGEPWAMPQFSANDFASYVWHFAKASSFGSRWSSDGVLSPGTVWKLMLFWRDECKESVKQKFDDALKCFLVLGSLGLRETRGLGAFVLKDEHYRFEDVQAILEKSGFMLEIRPTSRKTFARDIGALVKGTRKSMGWINDSRANHETASPMGTSTDPRQTSAIRFRPLIMADGTWKLLVFSPPYERVLGSKSRVNAINILGKNPSLLIEAKPVARRY